MMFEFLQFGALKVEIEMGQESRVLMPQSKGKGGFMQTVDGKLPYGPV